MTGRLTAGRISGVVGGVLQGYPETRIVRARADSRLCRPGDLYVALPGERTDGSLFAASAWENGADVVLGDRNREFPKPPAGKALVTVENPLAALQELARSIRRSRPDVRIVGITGSNGKTTTKEILASIMREWLGDSVLVSEGNYNSDIGLPLTLVGLMPEHRYAVLEMGMNRVGEMELLADIALPDIGLITNIGSAHAGRLGSVEAVAYEKRAIYSRAGRNTVAVLPEDESRADVLLEGFPGTVHRFGFRRAAGWESRTDLGRDGWSIVRFGREFMFRLPGEHNLRNALAAVEAAAVLGVPEDAVLRGLESVRPASGRSEIVDGRITVIRDCYNANPESLDAALQMVSGLDARGRRVLVIGELLELGDSTEDFLRMAGRQVAAIMPDAVFLFGGGMSVLAQSAVSSGYRGVLGLFTDISDLGEALAEYLVEGDLVLLKGSRGNALERLDPYLERVGAV